MLPVDHAKKASENIAFLGNFSPQKIFNDWSVTVMFYSALHMMDFLIYHTSKAINDDPNDNRNSLVTHPSNHT